LRISEKRSWQLAFFIKSYAVKICGIIQLSLFPFFFSGNSFALQAQWTSALGTNLSQTHQKSLWFNELNLRESLGEARELRSQLWLQNSQDSLRAEGKWGIPRIQLGMTNLISPDLLIRDSIYLYGFNLEDWVGSGWYGAISPGVEFNIKFFGALSFRTLLRNLICFSKYKMDLSGYEYPRVGFLEEIDIRYDFKPFWVEARFQWLQRYADLWRNDWQTQQQIGFQVNPNFSFGLAHQIYLSRVNEETGFYQSWSFFDSYQSRISIFLLVKLGEPSHANPL